MQLDSSPLERKNEIKKEKRKHIFFEGRPSWLALLIKRESIIHKYGDETARRLVRPDKRKLITITKIS